ncbi:MAG: hypothetical protein WBV73_20395 [Phormidium sp.]
MNTQLVESVVQVIMSLSQEERTLLEEKLFANLPYPANAELIQLAKSGGCFDFLNDEPDIYTLEDGEPI